MKLSFGDWSGEATPGNIPNPVVKLASADGTWGATPWESRSLPKDFSFSIDRRNGPVVASSMGRITGFWFQLLLHLSEF